MKTLIIYIIITFAVSINLIAQYNYVPNYSFEEKDSCGYGWRGVDLICKKWFTPMLYLDTAFNPGNPNTYGSSEYFNNCNNLSHSTPNNTYGYQIANTKESYVGYLLLGVKHPLNYQYTNYKEYIEVKLTSILLENKKYCVEFYYSLANFYNYHTISIEALITDTLVKREPDSLYWFKEIRTIAQVSSRLPNIPDTINWRRVSGSFIAKGGERYITIGNFENTDYIHNSAHYVFIDDVKLYYCGPDTTLQSTDSMIVPNIFTPNDDGYNDKFEYANQEQWEFETQVFSRWGNLVFDNNNSENWDGRIDGELVTSGVYFYVIKAVGIRGGEIIIYKGTVTIMY